VWSPNTSYECTPSYTIRTVRLAYNREALGLHSDIQGAQPLLVHHNGNINSKMLYRCIGEADEGECGIAI